MAGVINVLRGAMGGQRPSESVGKPALEAGARLQRTLERMVAEAEASAEDVGKGQAEKKDFSNRMSEAAITLEAAMNVKNAGNAAFGERDFAQAKRKYTEALALMERYDGAFSAAEDARIEEVYGPGPPVGG